MEYFQVKIYPSSKSDIQRILSNPFFFYVKRKNNRVFNDPIINDP